jgi:hypothetical protein
MIAGSNACCWRIAPAATDHDNHLAAIKMVKMQGGVIRQRVEFEGYGGSVIRALTQAMRIPPHDRYPTPPWELQCLSNDQALWNFRGAGRRIDEGGSRVQFHALLGDETEPVKSTLVKCVVGYYRPDAGQIEVNQREREIRFATGCACARHRDGISALYAGASMTVAREILVMARDHVPAVV